MLYSPIQPMHIPDGFLSTPGFDYLLGIISAGVVAYALRRVGKDLGERQVPLMGVLAAAIFAGQMLNFSVTGGTSGHLLGAALATILLGPWAAVIVMTSVVSIQALIFQDGGLLALGANLFNMAVVGVTVSYFVYTSIQKLARGKKWGIFVGGAAAAWFSIVIASLACALELALSGTSPANISVPAMGGIHMLIGIGEGLDHRWRAGLPVRGPARPVPHWRDRARREAQQSGSGGLAIAVLLAVLSPLASPILMAWNGWPGRKASWRPRGPRSTRLSQITSFPASRIQPWQPFWPASSARCWSLAWRLGWHTCGGRKISSRR